jgi:tRNA threonylcarbamoyladenosine biosynthesis protein TsaE
MTDGMTTKTHIPGTFITASPEETFALAEAIGQEIDRPTIFLLSGDLGTGKTLFAKGLAAGLGIDPDEVTSPSFTFINVHPQGRLPFYHIDLYRIEDARALSHHLGIEEILAEPAVIVIEWADKLGLVIGGTIYKVELRWMDETTRQITISQEAL